MSFPSTFHKVGNSCEKGNFENHPRHTLRWRIIALVFLLRHVCHLIGGLKRPYSALQEARWSGHFCPYKVEEFCWYLNVGIEAKRYIAKDGHGTFLYSHLFPFKSARSCADSENFPIGGQTLTVLFWVGEGRREDPNSTHYYKWVINECWLGSFVIFQGVRTNC